jgi:hypothetical protein
MTEAFRRYKASLVNVQWAVSAITDEGACVISLWTHYLRNENGVLKYEDTLSRWQHNQQGNNLLRHHLEEVQKNDLPVKPVFVRTEDTGLVDRGEDASKAKKRFFVRPELTGRLTLFDGDRFVIEFKREQ